MLVKVLRFGRLRSLVCDHPQSRNNNPNERPAKPLRKRVHGPRGVRSRHCSGSALLRRSATANIA